MFVRDVTVGWIPGKIADMTDGHLVVNAGSLQVRHLLFVSHNLLPEVIVCISLQCFCGECICVKNMFCIADVCVLVNQIDF